jgi:hypothetical protein
MPKASVALWTLFGVRGDAQVVGGAMKQPDDESRQSSAGPILFWAVLISLVAGWWFHLSATAMLWVALGVVVFVLLWPLIAMALVGLCFGAWIGTIEFLGWIAKGILWVTGRDPSQFKDGPDYATEPPDDA